MSAPQPFFVSFPQKNVWKFERREIGDARVNVQNPAKSTAKTKKKYFLTLLQPPLLIIHYSLSVSVHPRNLFKPCPVSSQEFLLDFIKLLAWTHGSTISPKLCQPCPVSYQEFLLDFNKLLAWTHGSTISPKLCQPCPVSYQEFLLDFMKLLALTHGSTIC